MPESIATSFHESLLTMICVWKHTHRTGRNATSLKMLVLSLPASFASFAELRRPTNCSRRSAASELSAGAHQGGYCKVFLKAIPGCMNSTNVSKQKGSSVFIEEQLDRHLGHLSQVHPQ